MAKSKLFEEAVKKLGKSKDSPKTNFKKAFDDYDKQIKRKKDKKSSFEKAFDDYDKQIKRKKNIKEIKKAAVPAALGTAGGTAGGTYVAKNKKKAGGVIKKLLSKKRKAGKKETNPYKSTVGDSYATRSKKQGEIEQNILKNTTISKKKKDEALKTLSERMKKERKETFDRRGMKAGGKVTSKCKRDGIAIRGRTKGRMV